MYFDNFVDFTRSKLWNTMGFMNLHSKIFLCHFKWSNINWNGECYCI